MSSISIIIIQVFLFREDGNKKNTVLVYFQVKFCKLVKCRYVSFDGVHRSEMFELVKRYKKILKRKCLLKALY